MLGSRAMKWRHGMMARQDGVMGLRRNSTGIAFLLALLIVWELAGQAEWINALIVPPP